MFEWIKQIWDYLWENVFPWFVVTMPNKALVMRVGKPLKVYDEGLHLKLPFIDQVYEHSMVPTTMPLQSQIFRTLSGDSLIVKLMINYQIADLQVFITEIDDAVDALSDSAQGIAVLYLSQLTDEELSNIKEINSTLLQKVRLVGDKMGLKVNRVTVTSLGDIMSLKLFNEEDTL